ncbi:MAG: signal peptidase I [Acidobacteria bacterium]|nr:signal peptidase I [Acidobacteriota bacterium]
MTEFPSPPSPTVVDPSATASSDTETAWSGGLSPSALPETKPSRHALREYFESIVVTVIIALFITTFVLQAYKIPTGSMESNLLIGDHLLVNKFIFSHSPVSAVRFLPYKEIKRGDIIVFKFPENPDQAFVKRVIGLPGELVSVMEKQVFINGVPLEEDYTQFIAGEVAYRPTYMNWNVPPNYYFAMVDNRDNSRDSREWGFVPRDYIIGKPVLIYWSFETEPNEHQRTTLSDRKNQLRDVVINFITKTRWDRTFRMIR